MLSDVDNANLFARCLIDEGLEVCKLRDENAEANKVMVKWHHEEGSASACNRLASVGIFINVVSLPGDKSSQESGLLFELNELTSWYQPKRNTYVGRSYGGCVTRAL